MKKQCLDYLREHGPADPRRIAVDTGLDYAKVTKALHNAKWYGQAELQEQPVTLGRPHGRLPGVWRIVERTSKPVSSVFQLGAG